MQNRATISLIYEMPAQIALETYKLKKEKEQEQRGAGNCWAIYVFSMMK